MSKSIKEQTPKVTRVFIIQSLVDEIWKDMLDLGDATRPEALSDIKSLLNLKRSARAISPVYALKRESGDLGHIIRLISRTDVVIMGQGHDRPGP